MKKILLIAFKFPPYAGVNAYRWSFLTKYMSDLGCQFHVLTVNWEHQGENTIKKTELSPSLVVHRIPSGGFHKWKYTPSKIKIINAIKSRINNYIIEKYYHFDDEADHWGKFLIPYCKLLISKEKISYIVATGHPFSSNYWASELKKELPEIKLIQDFQDPWFFCPSKKMMPSKYAEIFQRQKQAIEFADAIVTVTEGLLKDFTAFTNTKRVYVVENGFDPENIVNVGHHLNGFTPNDFSFAHLGSVTSRREMVLIKFLEAFKLCLSKVKKPCVTLIGKYPQKLLTTLFPNLVDQEILRFKGSVDQRQAFKYLLEHNYALQLNADIHPHLVSTKIYEYAALKMPTISINNGGEIDKLVSAADIGYSINVLKTQIPEELLKIASKKFHNFKFNVNQYSYKSLANKYLSVLNDLDT